MNRKHLDTLYFVGVQLVCCPVYLVRFRAKPVDQEWRIVVVLNEEECCEERTEKEPGGGGRQKRKPDCFCPHCVLQIENIISFSCRLNVTVQTFPMLVSDCFSLPQERKTHLSASVWARTLCFRVKTFASESKRSQKRHIVLFLSSSFLCCRIQIMCWLRRRGKARETERWL